MTVLRYQPTLRHRDRLAAHPLPQRSPWSRCTLGYDPLLQFVHAEDAVGALEAAVMRAGARPVNVAGAGSISLSRLLRLAGKIPDPRPLFSAALGRFGSASGASRRRRCLGRDA